jgi:hypothetical protein
MDTILTGAPMPKVFVSSLIRGQNVHRIVIDGQQRIGAILEFLRDGFALSEPYAGPYKELVFSRLPNDVQERFLQYRIDFNEAIGFSDEELREIYSRLNKYSFALNKQELRRADFPGAFLDLSEKLSANEYLDANGLFSLANRRRFGDVEFVSELLAALLSGPLDKREELDDHYLRYSKWEEQGRAKIERRFHNVLHDLALLFPDEYPLRGTRFRQKADFYSLFLALDSLLEAGNSVKGKNLTPLRNDLEILNYNIQPSSHVRDFAAYAVRCVSQANSVASRRWRKGLLTSVLAGTYRNLPPRGDAANFFYRAFADFDNAGAGLCPDPIHECPICGKDIKEADTREAAWAPSTTEFQLSRLMWLHAQCLANSSQWIRLDPPNPESEPMFTEDIVAASEPAKPGGSGRPTA